MNTIITIFLFLINTISHLILISFIMRIFLQIARSDYNNPICQFIVKITNPILFPFQKIIPPYKGLDIASFLIILTTQIFLSTIMFLVLGVPISLYIIIESIFRLLILILNLLFFLIIIRALFSWFQSTAHNPLSLILIEITEPILLLIREKIPLIAGIDISPIVVIIIIHILIIILQNFLLY